jgi:mRNA-degrading endonuclease RelE of RelBE toxin-antitoxin system
MRKLSPFVSEGVVEDLKALRASDRKRVLGKIDEQLTHRPTEETRNQKLLIGLKPPWEHEEPVRELRIGAFRVFYDVDDEGERVIIRAVRKKPPHQTTEEIL